MRGVSDVLKSNMYGGISMSQIKTIGVLTSGGDAPGMNACIRAVVRTGIARGLKIKGIQRGYAGLLKEEIVDMDGHSVSDIIGRGGTILYTARCLEFKQPEVQEEAANILKKHGIEGLVVIGGDGSFAGARQLANLGIDTIGLPGTIDLDIACTDYTIGYDTALMTAMEAVDKVRDTSSSHERCSIIEVMGRNAGYIALRCGIATGAEDIFIPERRSDFSIESVIKHVKDLRAQGKKHHIIIYAEGMSKDVLPAADLAKIIETETGIESRATELGHIQRGGSPTATDRFYASMFGAKAVDLLLEGKSKRVVGYRKGEFVDYDINEALAMKKDIDEYEYSVSKLLVR